MRVKYSYCLMYGVYFLLFSIMSEREILFSIRDLVWYGDK